MADYTGGASSAALQNQDVSNSLAHQQTAAILNAMRNMAMQQEMRQQQARGPAMEQLAGLFGGGQPQAPRMPMVPPPPGTLAGGPQPPPPGTSSEPMARPGAMPTGAVPPPPMGAGATPAAGPMGAPAAAPIAPFRPLPPSGDSSANMPKIPQPGGGATAGIPPPPAEAPPAAAAPADTGPPGIGQAKLREAIASVSKLPMSSAQKMDVLDQMMPVLNKAEQQELSFYKAQTQALQVTEKFYRDALRDAWEKEKRPIQQQNADTRTRDVERKEGQGDRRLDQGQQRIDAKIDKGIERGLSKNTKSAASAISDEDARFQAERIISGDRSGTIGFGRGKQGAENLAKIQQFVRTVANERGIPADQLATKIAEFEGLKAGERTLGNRTATFGMAKSEAYEMADLVTQSSDKVGRTRFQPVNKAIVAYEKNTGDVEVRQFGAALNSFINAYARAISPTGVSTVSDKEHAREMLSMADSPEQVKGIIAQLKKEMDAAGRAPGIVKRELSESMRPGGGEGGAKKISSDAEFNALPSGTTFIAPDGTTRKKP